MSEMLYRKHRPSTLDGFFGNTTVKKSLQSKIKNQKIPQVIMFFGEYGCGKTTLARILANETGCSDIDLEEVDIGVFTGVDHSRKIRDQMFIKPRGGKVRVWILDEIQEATTTSQRALLKALEEPPSYVYVFLCTTEPNKLISTLKSRFVQYSISPLPDKVMKKVVSHIVQKEEVRIPEEVVDQIVKDSLGHSRDALNILEKVIHLEEKNMLRAAKREASKQNQTIDLCKSIMKKSNWGEIAEILRGLDEDPERIRRFVIKYFSTVLLRGNPLGAIVLENFQQPLYTNGYPGLVFQTYSTYIDLQEPNSR